MLSSFHRILALGEVSDTARVHFILHRLISEYMSRLPAGRDGRAIRELLTWEDADGDARSLTTRYHHAAAHLVNAPGDFGRRQEPRLLLECARRFIAFDHDDRLDVGEAPAVTGAPPAALASEPGLSPLAPLLWTKAEEEHQRRLAAIHGGIFSVSNQEEVLDLLLTITRVAEHSLHAVDQTGLERWFGNARLQYYLDAQLERARADKIDVERLRFIRRGAPTTPRGTRLLPSLDPPARGGGAPCSLCPAEAARELRTSFDSRMFMALVDIGEHPACLTGWLGEEGYIERSLLYLRELDPVQDALHRHAADHRCPPPPLRREHPRDARFTRRSCDRRLSAGGPRPVTHRWAYAHQRRFTSVHFTGYSSTSPDTQVTVAPPTQIVASSSRSTRTRPARPSSVPCDTTRAPSRGPFAAATARSRRSGSR